MSSHRSNERFVREEGNASVRSVKKKWRAGVLGATGIVGQRLVHLLADHPWFELTEVAASERSSGKSYAEATRWHLETPIPDAARNLTVKGLEPALDCDFVFSGLDSSVAGVAEEDFARAGYPVVSNSRNYRMMPTVPLLIPEIIADHLRLLDARQLHILDEPSSPKRIGKATIARQGRRHELPIAAALGSLRVVNPELGLDRQLYDEQGCVRRHSFLLPRWRCDGSVGREVRKQLAAVKRRTRSVDPRIGARTGTGVIAVAGDEARTGHTECEFRQVEHLKKRVYGKSGRAGNHAGLLCGFVRHCGLRHRPAQEQAPGPIGLR